MGIFHCHKAFNLLNYDKLFQSVPKKSAIRQNPNSPMAHKHRLLLSFIYVQINISEEHRGHAWLSSE